MDTITHGILAGAVSQALLSRRLPRGAGMIGAVGGMAPDLDIFIRSMTDPTVGWVFHRHFTHSLILIPVGGLIAALPFLWMNRFKNQRKEVLLASTIGYSTHGLLDALTSYGTQLYWPFSSSRVAWDWIGIVDPIYTLILLIGVVITARTKQAKSVRIALLLSILYLGFGVWQHHRAVEVQKQLAALRGHQLTHWRVMPAPGWLLYWRSVYLANGHLYADGIRVPWFSSPLVLEGGSTDATTLEDLPQNAQANAETRRQFQILNWFADGMIASIKDEPNATGDMRITAAVEGLLPLWGLKFDPSSGRAQRWTPPLSIRRDYAGLLRGLFLGDPRYRLLSTLPADNVPKSAN
ncbi:MAG: metal-dependent hydrolase [Acidobacteria bacterium]|nr:metal-dependent hydrolase [Acidobacteriota bacterium]